jgi:hypothetical protein
MEFFGAASDLSFYREYVRIVLAAVGDYGLHIVILWD